MALAELAKNILRIQQKHALCDVGFDTECILNLGSLSSLLRMVLEKTFPEQVFQLHENISEDKNEVVG